MTGPLADELVDPVVVSSEVAFEGMVWNVRRERFVNGTGEITREFVDHTGAVAILAMDDRERVLLIKQYRHAIRAREWELPAGLLDVSGESPVLAAQRELAEEVDLAASDWAVLTDFVSTPGGNNEHLRVYLARGLSDTDVFHRTDEEADIEKRWASLDEVVEAVLERRIQNSILAMAVLTASAAKLRGWATLGAADEPWPRHPAIRYQG
jgi:8-oxo-dGTP pyrophosphatase MutT (NUDIX family)